jgi:hypothetical protein
VLHFKSFKLNSMTKDFFGNHQKNSSDSFNWASVRTETIYLIGLMVLLFLLLKTCSDNVQSDYRLKHTIYEDSVLIASQRKVIAQAGSDAAKQAQHIAELEVKVKNASEVVRIETRTIIKTQIKLGDTVMIDKQPYIQLPKPFIKQTEWYTIGGMINRLGWLQIDSISIPAKFTYAVGDTMRTGFVNRIFRKSDQVVRLRVDNPNVSITGMENIYIKQDKKWHQTTAFKVGVGLLIGVAVTSVGKN